MQPLDTQAIYDAAVVRVVVFFENLSPADLAALGTLYAPEARFKDPFNEVQGLPAITHIFEHRIGMQWNVWT